MKKIIILLSLLTLLSGCEKDKFVKENRLNEEVYIYEDLQIPTALKTPQLKLEYLAENKNKTFYDLKDEINTYADAMMLIKNRNISPDEEILKILSILLKGDYEEIDTEKVYTGYKIEYLLSIKSNGKFYLLDPISTYQGNNIWLEDFNLEKGSFDSKEELENALLDNYKTGKNVNCVILQNDPDGNKIEFTYKNGEVYYDYKGFKFVLGYGLPLLTDKEIKDLLDKAEKGDFDSVKEKITTIPDMIYFLKKYGIKQAGMDNIAKGDGYNGADVGNIFYDFDQFNYTLSGKELMMVKEVQCSASSTLFHYLLNGDFQEVGYVPIVFISNDDKRLDGHVINYIKNNNKYYLVSPSYYLSGDSAWEYIGIWDGADTIDEVMEQLYASYYPNGKVISTAAYLYDGIYVMSDRRDFSSNQVALRVFPEGSDVKSCLGSPYEFALPKHPTDQDYILDVKLKK